MRGRWGKVCLASAALALVATDAGAQMLTGEIFGRVSDGSGAVLPGVTVTLQGPALMQPEVAVTTETGAYAFPRLPVGTYTVRFDLPGFKQVVQEGVRSASGFSAEINVALDLSPVQETVTVTGESPVVDTRQTTCTAIRARGRRSGAWPATCRTRSRSGAPL